MLKTLKRLPYWPQKLLSEQKVHGGKTYLCRRIWKTLPLEYEVNEFFDLYGGSGVMCYNAPAHIPHVIYNEKNWFRYMTKEVLRDSGSDLQQSLRRVKYCEETFLEARSCIKRHTQGIITLSPFCMAYYWIIASKMSRGGLGEAYSWSERTRGKTRATGPKPEQLNNWESMLDRLPALTTRLQSQVLHQGLAIPLLHRIIRQQPGNKKFFYLDPPYPKALRSTDAVEYGPDEMTNEQHEEMLTDVLAASKIQPDNYFAISSYPNDLYDKMLGDWYRVDFSMPNHACQCDIKSRRTERLYTNYLPVVPRS